LQLSREELAGYLKQQVIHKVKKKYIKFEDSVT
jgi:hypothetical protein